MIITQKDISQNLEIGNKAIHLKKLADAGYHVPGFIVVPKDVVSDYFHNKIERNNLISEITSSLNVTKYIIRSSSSLEDNTGSSLAGQFHSEIDVSPEELEHAIQITIEKSIKESEKNLGSLSLIIQEYITADYAGITFTRSPKGSRELVIEYHKGIGVDIVGGNIKPKIEKYYHSEIHNSQENIVLNDIIPNSSNNIGTDFINIEKFFGFPMDIEWCIQGGVMHFLQARNITTLSHKQYEEIGVLERLLENNNKYYYEKNEISEVCPRPTQFMLSLFDKIYSKNGPLHRFYTKNNISFEYVNPTDIDTHVIKIIGNELYIDKQKEIESLLRGANMYRSKSYTPNLWSFKGSMSRLKNLYYLFKIKENKDKIERQLDTYFCEDFKDDSFEGVINKFLEAYETIYEINYFTSGAFKKLQLAIKNEDISFSEIITINKELIHINNFPEFHIDTSDFRGNSININDENEFIGASNKKSNLAAEQYWESLPEWKKNYLGPIVSQAIYYEYMREIGRYLTVKYVSVLRYKIDILSSKLNLKENIYFTNIDEIISGNIDEKLLFQREYEFNRYNIYNFPSVISDRFVHQIGNAAVGISGGVVEGMLCSLEELENKLGKDRTPPSLPLSGEGEDNENIILYVSILSPELTKYFPDIHGIISEKGGELSHLAIMAREHNIPVVSNCNMGDISINYGDFIEINGNNGNIVKK